MKFVLTPFLMALLLIALPAPAQVDDSDADAPAPPGSTVITSDELHSDQAAHISVFTGKVIVTGQNFHMTCQEMTVYFSTDNKVVKLVATGDVIITQPDRVTHCGHAEYTRDTDVFDLTDQPVIFDHKNEVKGAHIQIDRRSQKMSVLGGRSTVVIQEENLGGGANATTPPQPGK